MMFFDWQTGIALLLVAGALYFLGRKSLQFFRKIKSGTGCPSDCGGCAPTTNGSATEAPAPIVDLELPSDGNPASK